MSYTLSLHHIVFGTKNRRQTITEANCDQLYKILFHLSEQKKCQAIRVNGMPDHIHMLVDLHPSISLADFVKQIKQNSSIWAHSSGLFPYFDGWAKEYFSHSVSEKDSCYVKTYIENQKIHHQSQSFAEEYQRLIEHVGLTYFGEPKDPE